MRFAMPFSSVSYKGLGLSQQAFLTFSGRDLKMRKSASVATLAVLATLLPFPFFHERKVQMPI
ncbi:hypothetical protein LJC34_04065, partial [Oscillospiraceae bacterium OttesenSCG-928-G22]|nr:hypothetical protein [Oscillospiraceae bacterium OttesenSCG-928-G22]